MTISNEHPDMSGNPCDEPFLCDHCNKQIREEDIVELPDDDEHMFCSNQCAEEWDDAQRDTDPLY